MSLFYGSVAHSYRFVSENISSYFQLAQKRKMEKEESWSKRPGKVGLLSDKLICVILIA